MCYLCRTLFDNLIKKILQLAKEFHAKEADCGLQSSQSDWWRLGLCATITDSKSYMMNNRLPYPTHALSWGVLPSFWWMIVSSLALVSTDAVTKETRANVRAGHSYKGKGERRKAGSAIHYFNPSALHCQCPTSPFKKTLLPLGSEIRSRPICSKNGTWIGKEKSSRPQKELSRPCSCLPVVSCKCFFCHCISIILVSSGSIICFYWHVIALAILTPV